MGSIMPSKSLLITDSDLDGLGSAVLSKVFGIKYDEIKLSTPRNMNTEEMMTFIEPFDYIVVADLSFDEEHMRAIQNKNKHIVVYDHHITSSYLNNPEKYPGSISDPSRCGTKIYYSEYIVKPRRGRFTLPALRFVNLVDTYDRWLKNDAKYWEDACKLNRVYLYHRKEPWKFIEIYTEKLKQRRLEFDEEDERKSECIINSIKAAYAYSERWMKVYPWKEGGNYAITYHTGYCSDVGSDLVNNYKLNFVVMIDTVSFMTVSVRSVEEFDCTRFEGIKGHKNAAGGKFPSKFLEDVYEGKDMFKLKG